jgi:hypothetical protein
MQEIVIAKPSERIIAIKRTGIAQNICQEKETPKIVRITRNTMIVGKNLNRATTTAEIGSIIRGKAVFRIKR